MRITHKLTLAITAGAALILALNGWLRLRREEAMFHFDTEHDLRALAAALAGAAEEEWENEGDRRVQALLNEAQRRSKGEIHLRWLETPPGGLPAQGEVVHSRDQVLIRVPVGDGKRRTLEVKESLGAAYEYLRFTAMLTIGAACLLGLFMCAVALLAGERLVGRPVRRLVALARRIGEGDLAARVEGLPRDEMGLLGDELNAMAARLERTRAELQEEVAARLAAQAQLRHAERLSTVGQLAAGIAHELGTPLNVVSGRAKLVATRPLEREEMRENARIIGEQAARMAAIIRQLLDFTRRGTAHRTAQDLRRLAERTRELLHSLAQKTRVTLRLELDPQPVPAAVDGTQVEQVLTNLVMNAVQATPEGGEVTLVAGRGRCPPLAAPGPEGECAFLAVRDQGCGVEPELIPRLFEPFFTTKDVGQGTGLGLSVAHGIVADHGGRIDVSSAPGRGSTFTVWLPLASASAAPPAAVPLGPVSPPQVQPCPP